MLKLLNIKKNNNIISAEYAPESSSNTGYIELDVASGEVIDGRMSKHDEAMAIYYEHAKEALKKLIKEETLPKEKVVMWY